MDKEYIVNKVLELASKYDADLTEDDISKVVAVSSFKE